MPTDATTDILTREQIEKLREYLALDYTIQHNAANRLCDMALCSLGRPTTAVQPEDVELVRGALVRFFFAEENADPVRHGAIERAFNRILAAQTAHPIDGWQPIETAPKDGTVILAYVDDGFGWHILPIWWEKDHWHDGEDPSRVEQIPPTHWMLLPAPPIAAIEGDKK